MNTFRSLLATLASAAVLTLAGCSESATMAENCGGSVASAAVDGSTLTAAGTFNNGQPIVELSMGDAHHDYPATDYNNTSATFDLTGLPAGTYTVSWLISCNEGGEQTLNGSKVTSITIH